MKEKKGDDDMTERSTYYPVDISKKYREVPCLFSQSDIVSAIVYNVVAMSNGRNTALLCDVSITCYGFTQQLFTSGQYSVSFGLISLTLNDLEDIFAEDTLLWRNKTIKDLNKPGLGGFFIDLTALFRNAIYLMLRQKLSQPN